MRENELRKVGKRAKRRRKAERDNSTTAKRYRTVEGSSDRGDRDGGNGRETTAIGAGTSENERQEDEREENEWRKPGMTRRPHSDGGTQ